MQLVDVLAHHCNGSIAVAVRCPLRDRHHFDDGHQGGDTLAQYVEGLHGRLSPALALGSGVPIQQCDGQCVLGEQQRQSLLAVCAVCTASSISSSAASSGRRTP
jgi:hypothetical protein